MIEIPELKGTQVSAPIVMPTTEDVFPTHYPEYGRGGKMEVPDANARLAIKTHNRNIDMEVTQQDTHVKYTLRNGLTNADWEIMESGKDAMPSGFGNNQLKMEEDGGLYVPPPVNEIINYEYYPGLIVSFTSDDCAETDYTKFKPIFEEEGVPCCLCLPTSYLNKPTYMNESQLRELYDMGWSIASHGHISQNFTQLTSDALHEDIKRAQDIVKKLGFDYDICVYPGGGTSTSTRNIVRKYYKMGIGVGYGGSHNNSRKFNNSDVIENMQIWRVWGLDYGGTLDDMKAMVDADLASGTGNWLIFESHSWEAYWDESGLNNLKELIRYVKSKGIPIVNYRQGMGMKANLLESGDYEGSSKTRIRKNGSTDSKASMSGGGKSSYSLVIGSTSGGDTIDSVDVLCNGTGDRDKIYSAVNYLTQGGTVFFKKGTYNFDLALSTPRENLTYEGEYGATVFKRMFANTSSDSAVVSLSNKNCIVRNIKIDGNSSVHTGSRHYGVLMNQSECTVCNCIVVNTDGGIKSIANNNTIRDNILYSGTMSGDGITVVTGRNQTIMNNRCDNFAYGFTITGSNHVVSSGNIATNSAYGGLRLYTATDTTVIGNNFRDNPIGISIQSASVRNSIIGNACHRGNGLTTDYTSSQYTIRVSDTNSKNNFITANYCWGKSPTNFAGDTTNHFINNPIDIPTGDDGGTGIAGVSRRENSIVVGSSVDGYTSSDVDVLCDGINDREVIYSAINFLTNGGTVFFKKGTYTMVQPLLIPRQYITLEGEGHAVRFVRGFSNTSTDTGIVSMSSSNCKIIGIRFDGNGSTYSSSRHHAVMMGSDNSTIINCVIENVDAGIKSTGNYNEITNCKLTSFSGLGDGIICSVGKNQKIIGNTCNKFAFGFTITGENHIVTGGNSATESIDAGLRLYTATDCIVNGNLFRDNPIGINVQNISSRNTIIGNSCYRGTGTSTEYLSSQSTIKINDVNSKKNFITGNMCLGKAPENYMGDNTNNILNNFVIDPESAPEIMISPRTNSIVIGSSLDGYIASEVDVLVNGTDDYDKIYSSINYLTNGGSVFLRKGTYYMSQALIFPKQNIILEGEGYSSIIKRNFTNTGTDTGIVSLSSAYCTIRNLRLDGNVSTHTSSRHYAVLMSGTNCAIENCMIENTDGGIKSMGNNNRIQFNVLLGNNTSNVDGITTTTGKFMKVIGNTCNNFSYGFNITGESHTISNNSATASVNGGLRLYTGIGCMVVNNMLKDNPTGILLTSSSVRNYILTNECSRGTGIAADYTGSQYTIRVSDAASINNYVALNGCRGRDPVNYSGDTTNQFVNNVII